MKGDIFSVHSGLIVLIFPYKSSICVSKFFLLSPLSMSAGIINASSLFTGTFLRSITQSGAAKMNQSAGEQL